MTQNRYSYLDDILEDGLFAGALAVLQILNGLLDHGSVGRVRGHLRLVPLRLGSLLDFGCFGLEIKRI